MPSLLSAKPDIDFGLQKDISVLHKLECRACPLNDTRLGGKLEPTGTASPLIYCLGEAPGQTEAEERVQFVGDSGQLLREHIPRKFENRIRFNNCARSWPGRGNPTPSQIMLEACRPSVVRDIEATKPKAIFGFGNIPLTWVSGFSGITLWRGRRMPVRVGSHVCWFYPMLHPAYLLRNRRFNDMPSEEERMFQFDLERAFAEVETLPQAVVHTAEDARRNIDIAVGDGPDDLERVREALAWAKEQPVIGLDYETVGLRPYAANARILSAAVATLDDGFAFALDHPESQWSASDRKEVGALWCDFLANAKGIKAAHNAAFEMEWTGFFFGKEYLRAGCWADTQTQACILDERKGNKKGGPLSLEFLVQQYFGFNIKKIAGVDRANLAEEPIEAVLYYNAPDARYAAGLCELQGAQIEEDGLQECYELAVRSVPTVVLTQLKGLPVDQSQVKHFGKKYGTKLEKVLADIAAVPVVQEFEQKRGKRFAPLSNPDVLTVFKDYLKRPEVLVTDKFTKARHYSTDESVLAKIDHPLARLLLDLRSVNKSKSTYVDPLAEGAPTLYPDGCLHSVFNTTFAETGRLSSEGPNLQNFPKRDNDAKEVRKQICAPLGCLMLAFDFGQIEARVIAMATKDKRFCQALWERYDVHMEWAERLAHAYPNVVGGKKMLGDKNAMKKFRTDVKNQWTFPLFFGAKLESAAGYLQIPLETLRPHYNEFWKQFSGVKAWQQQLLAFYKKNGYVECLTGRRRRGPMSPNQIFNSPVQGTAAAIVVDAMTRLSETGDPELQPEINIHDDLTWARVPEGCVDQLAESIIGIMLDVPFPWAKLVPITIEGSIGQNWLEMSEFGTFSSDEWGLH